MTVSNQFRPAEVSATGPSQEESRARAAPRFMQVLIICDVKKLVSPFLSTVILRKSSRRIGQIALVGCCVRAGTVHTLRTREQLEQTQEWSTPYRHVHRSVVPGTHTKSAALRLGRGLNWGLG